MKIILLNYNMKKDIVSFLYPDVDKCFLDVPDDSSLMGVKRALLNANIIIDDYYDYIDIFDTYAIYVKYNMNRYSTGVQLVTTNFPKNLRDIGKKCVETHNYIICPYLDNKNDEMERQLRRLQTKILAKIEYELDNANDIDKIKTLTDCFYNISGGN